MIIDLFFNIFMVFFSRTMSHKPCPNTALQDLREKLEELNRQILKEEEDKAKIQKEPWHAT